MSICPICNGKGEIEPPSNDKLEKGEAARILHREGWSYRQIGKLLNIRSPRSVQLLVKGQQENHGNYSQYKGKKFPTNEQTH